MAARFPAKPSTNLANGIFIGLGCTLIIVGLIIAFSTNAAYNQQISYLSARGIQVNIYASGLDNLVQLITLATLITVLGTYALIIGTLNQFSFTVRTAMESKNSRTRWGNSLISGGFVWSALVSSNFVEQFYHPSSAGWYAYVTVGFVVGGLLLVLAGALLIRSSYLRSRLSTKV
jgi:hypothetical protein